MPLEWICLVIVGIIAPTATRAIESLLAHINRNISSSCGDRLQRRSAVPSAIVLHTEAEDRRILHDSSLQPLMYARLMNGMETLRDRNLQQAGSRGCDRWTRAGRVGAPG